MSLTIYEASVPVFIRGLQNLAKLLEMAVAQGLNPATLVGARLAPDMFTLAGQVQSASDAAKAGAGRLADVERPSFPDTETTMPELQERIAKTIAFLRGIDPARFEAAADRTITLTVRGGSLNLSGQDYLLKFAIPNFFFHIATAHGILRHSGAGIGKMDYLGAF
jgi:hypothetical protein